MDIPALKDLMKQAGCVLAEGFEIELEKYLRILMARYIPKKSKKSYASTRNMSVIMMSLFSGEIYSIDYDLRVTEDKNAIRIWNKEFFNPQKRIKIIGLPQHIREHCLYRSKMTKQGFTVAHTDITKLIPRTIRHRRGNHKYVTFVFGRKNITIFNSKTPATLQSEVSVLSDVIATNLLLIKDQDVIVRLIRRKGNRNLLVTGSRFEIFFK